MEKVKLNLKALGERKLDYGFYYVEEVDGEYYLCANAGHIVALDGDILECPEWTRFAIETETGEYIYLSQEEFELACIPVKKEQDLQSSEELPDEKPIESLLEEKVLEDLPEDPRIVRTRMETIDMFLKALLNSGFDSGIGYGCDNDAWFDYGVEAVKERAEVIAKEMKESLLQRISDKEEEAER